MLGVVSEDIAVPTASWIFPCCFIAVFDCCRERGYTLRSNNTVPIQVLLNLSRSKVDRASNRTVGTTQIENKNIVDKHPDIIITGEVEYHFFAIQFSVSALIEIHVHPHTEPVVHIGGFQIVSARIVEVCPNHLTIGVVEWQEVIVFLCTSISGCGAVALHIITDTEHTVINVIVHSIVSAVVIVMGSNFLQDGIGRLVSRDRTVATAEQIF